MITDLDETLERLLIEGMPIENGEVEVKFDLPRREWAAKLSRPTINLYLYDIRENMELRRNEWAVERDGEGRATKRKAPVRVDLSYLVTAWTSAVEDEHRLLWRALWVFFRNPVLSGEILPGALKEANAPLPLSIAQPDKMPDMVELWGTLDNELKPTLHLVVTLPLDLALAVSGPLVLTKRVRVEEGLAGEGPFEEATQVAGTLRDGEGHPITGAKVMVSETGATTQTDLQGRFRFRDLPEGNYTLVVEAPGRRRRKHGITVLSERYDLTLE